MTTPDFRVIAEGADITAAIRRGLLSLSVTDEAGFTSDKTEIKLDDRDGKISMPRTGAKLEISLGYKETGLVNMGIYVVDEVTELVSKRPIQIGYQRPDYAQVDVGLEEGELIALSGFDRLEEGAKVRVIEKQEAEL